MTKPKEELLVYIETKLQEAKKHGSAVCSFKATELAMIYRALLRK